MNDKSVSLVKTRWGYYQYKPLPSDEELQSYYAERYFQLGRGSYKTDYSKEEIEWFRLRSRLLCEKSEQLTSTGMKRCIDIGCGEGWLLDEFHRRGHEIKGLDFSIAGIQKFNPHLLSFFHQGNIYELLEKIILKKDKFDIVAIVNVIEHVKFPDKLLTELKSMLEPESILIVFAPNDFSQLQLYLEKQGFISKKWWLMYPDHLSYFNMTSMCNLLNDKGFEVLSVVGDHPIDLNLLNDNSNYVEDESKGPNTHQYRVRYDNFLGQLDPDGLLKISETFGSMGVGRNLAYYCSMKK